MKTNLAATRHTRCIAPALAVALALAACQATPAPTPQSTAGPTPITVQPSTSPTNRIAVIDAGGMIYTVDPDGGERIELNASGAIPDAALVWAPDGSRLAFSLATASDSQLVTVDARGEDRVTVYRDVPAAAPFYLSWSPDSRHLAFLSTGAQGRMALQFARAIEADSTQVIERGQPNYFSWSPEGERLVLHIGGTRGFVGTFMLGDDDAQRRDDAPALFQAPAWSPTGDAYLFARVGESSQDDLILVRGGVENVVATYDGGVIFNWAPDGRQVAYSVLDESRRQYAQLTVVDVDDDATRRLVDESHLAFFWSPDGTKIAYLTAQLVSPGAIGRVPDRQALAAPRIDQTGQVLELTWNLVEVASGQKTALASFAPSDHFLFVVPFFDQYAQSITFWSPDSRYLLLAGTPLARDSAIYRIDTQADGERLTRIGPGRFAIWSWQ